mmetsp:Transcript_10795/g.17060  ORF Transcript_10795/g.17060 Transcript_10795/m.17060 type:complete len:225 (-) Transcript_10795:205-879(-)
MQLQTRILPGILLGSHAVGHGSIELGIDEAHVSPAGQRHRRPRGRRLHEGGQFQISGERRCRRNVDGVLRRRSRGARRGTRQIDFRYGVVVAFERVVERQRRGPRRRAEERPPIEIGGSRRILLSRCGSRRRESVGEDGRREVPPRLVRRLPLSGCIRRRAGGRLRRRRRRRRRSEGESSSSDRSGHRGGSEGTRDRYYRNVDVSRGLQRLQSGVQSLRWGERR